MTTAHDQPEPHTRCHHCGYDLHGLAHDALCPECGQARPIVTPFDELGVDERQIGELDVRKTCYRCNAKLDASIGDAPCPKCGAGALARLELYGDAQYNRTLAILTAEGLAAQARRNALANLGGILGSTQVGAEGFIWIPITARKRAVELIHAMDLPLPLRALPIVSVDDPRCPQCAADIDPEHEPTCPNCGCAFHWHEDDMPLEPWRLDHCGACGYDLRGIDQDQCPECSALISHDLDAMEREAAGEMSGPSAHRTVRADDLPKPFAGRRGLIFIIVVLVMLLIPAAINIPTAGWGLFLILAIWLVVIATGLTIDYFLLNNPRRTEAEQADDLPDDDRRA